LFQDMKADGLCARRDQAADVVYDRSQTATVFDGDWDKRRPARYEREFVAADQQYTRLLTVLLAQLRGTS